jgi:hypothetical protein
MSPFLRAAGLWLLVGLSVAVGCDSDGSAPAAPGERGGILLGSARTPSGTVIQLYSFRDGGGPCLNIAGLPGGTRACGRAPSERVPPVLEAIGGGAIVRRSAHAPLELYGETLHDVHRVVLRYRLPHGRPGRRSATLIRADDRDALRSAGIREPFGYFVGAVPPRARRVTAVALDRSARELGKIGFDRLARSMPPTVFISVEDEPRARP